LRAALLLAILLLLPPLAAAASYPDPQKAPRYFDSTCIAQHDRRFVYDYVGLLDARMGQAIEDAACEVYANTSAHFVLATVPDTGDESLESYSLHMFETWGIGTEEDNNGILLLYVDHYNLSGKSSALRVEVGYGLEGVVNGHVSADAIRLMQSEKQKALDGGLDEASAKDYAMGSGAAFLLQTIADGYTDGHFPAPQPQDPGSPPVWFWIVGIVFALALLQGFARHAHGASGWGYQTGSSGAWQGVVAGMFIRDLMRRGGGGGGGWGGGGFGGGGFGGGGFGGGRSGGGGGSGGF
jgi:uncharacterized protein